MSNLQRKRKRATIVAPAEALENKCRVCRLLAASTEPSSESASASEILPAVTDACDFDVLRCPKHRNQSKKEMYEVLFPKVYVLRKPARFRGGGTSAFWLTQIKDLPSELSLLKLEFKTFESNHLPVVYMITKHPLNEADEEILGLSGSIIENAIVRVGDNTLYAHQSMDTAAKLLLQPKLVSLPLIPPK